jgi:uncharacterized alpha-E superfamily protein
MLDLLVRDAHNPRSVYFQLKGLNDFVGRILDAYGADGGRDKAAEERLEAAAKSLETLDPGADLRHGSERLAALLQEWHDASGSLSEQLGLRFFSHVGEVNRQTFAM